MFQQFTAWNAIGKGYEQISETARERQMATQLFERALHEGKVKQWGRSLWRRSRALLQLACHSPSGQQYLGTQSVPLSKIRGSENRTRDFDIDFYPVEEHLEERWVRLAAAQLHGETLPPVELIQVEDTYFVRDGHHRISVARALNQEEIDAEVVLWKVAT